MIQPERIPYATADVERCSYHIREYRIDHHCPRRWQTVKIGVIEGAELFSHELRELERDCRKQPWQFPEVSILDEFDEWISQTTYRIAGYLTWRYQGIYEW